MVARAGHLLAGSNFNDEQKKTVGGRNGYGIIAPAPLPHRPPAPRMVRIDAPRVASASLH